MIAVAVGFPEITVVFSSLYGSDFILKQREVPTSNFTFISRHARFFVGEIVSESLGNPEISRLRRTIHVLDPRTEGTRGTLYLA